VGVGVGSREVEQPEVVAEPVLAHSRAELGVLGVEQVGHDGVEAHEAAVVLVPFD